MSSDRTTISRHEKITSGYSWTKLIARKHIDDYLGGIKYDTV